MDILFDRNTINMIGKNNKFNYKDIVMYIIEKGNNLYIKCDHNEIVLSFSGTGKCFAR